jgi:hypothetical protein
MLPPSTGGSPTPLAPWDFWTEDWFDTSDVGGSVMFLAAVISSGTATTAIPSASLQGYNRHGRFIRSSTTANGGYRFQTVSLVADYFGVVSHKFRGRFLWRTSFSNVTVRMGYLDTSTVTDAVDGAYFEIVGSTCSAKTANNSTRTTHGTTLTLSLDVGYTFDIEVNAAGTEARFRVYAGQTTTPALDVTITTNIPTSSARSFGCGLIATESTTTAVDIGIVYSLGTGTVAGYEAANTIGGGGGGGLTVAQAATIASLRP